MRSRTVRRASLGLAVASALTSAALPGCHPIPVEGDIHAGVHFAGDLDGTFNVNIPPAPDPGPIEPIVVRAAACGPGAPRVAVLDVDGIIVNQNLTGVYSTGENPVSMFREKLEAAANDPAVRAVVLRINSPGGGVAATDLIAEELQRFRAATRKPVVSCLMDVATGGAYYLALGGDEIMAQPTSITGAIGALVNHVNMEDAMAQLNVRVDSVKAGEMIDMASVTRPLSDEARALLQEMANGFRDRFLDRLKQYRPQMTDKDRAAIADARIFSASKALGLHLVDRLGYLDDAIGDAERLAGVMNTEVVMYHRKGTPIHSVYAIMPNTPLQNDIIPFSYPGLDRDKLPTFLYLWQPDPTLGKVPGR